MLLLLHLLNVEEGKYMECYEYFTSFSQQLQSDNLVQKRKQKDMQICSPVFSGTQGSQAQIPRARLWVGNPQLGDICSGVNGQMKS